MMAEKAFDQAENVLSGRKIIVGLTFGQANLAFNRERPLSDGTKVRPDLTDNGRLNFLFQYETTESFLFEIPLLVGKLGVGYNLIFGLTSVETNRNKWITFSRERTLALGLRDIT